MLHILQSWFSITHMMWPHERGTVAFDAPFIPDRIAQQGPQFPGAFCRSHWDLRDYVVVGRLHGVCDGEVVMVVR